MPSGVLFVHNNFPGQFGDLAATLQALDVPCCAIAQNHARGMPSVRTSVYGLLQGTTPGIFPLAVRAEADLVRAHGAWRAGKALKAEGWEPAVIIGHPGWGETVLLSEVFPEAKQVAFAEYFYHPHRFDVGFDEEFGSPDPERALRIRAKNLTMSLAYAEADAIVTPTRFQGSTLPAGFQNRIRVIHEGVDVNAVRPAPAEPFELADGRVIPPGAPVITHVNNNMEPLRGLHIFARALPQLLAEVPEAQVIVIGEAKSSGYGGNAPEGLTWKDVCFRDVPIDPARVHFLGKVPHARMLAALRLSVAHVYYSYPFVLSWSLVEAMASGCYVVASDTAPLRDAIQDGVNGRLLPFFEVEALSQALIDACRNPAASDPLRAAARETAVREFSREKGRAGWTSLLRELGLEIPHAPPPSPAAEDP